MSWADTLAVKTVIEEVPALTDKTFVSMAPTGPELATPYVIVHPSEGTPEQTRFTGPPSTEHPEFTLHVVGSTANQVQIITGLIRAKFAVNGFTVPPVVDGRTNRDGYFQPTGPIQTDTDATPALIYQVVELGWASDPA